MDAGGDPTVEGQICRNGNTVKIFIDGGVESFGTIDWDDLTDDIVPRTDNDIDISTQDLEIAKIFAKAHIADWAELHHATFYEAANHWVVTKVVASTSYCNFEQLQINTGVNDADYGSICALSRNFFTQGNCFDDKFILDIQLILWYTPSTNTTAYVIPLRIIDTNAHTGAGAVVGDAYDRLPNNHKFIQIAIKDNGAGSPRFYGGGGDGANEVETSASTTIAVQLSRYKLRIVHNISAANQTDFYVRKDGGAWDYIGHLDAASGGCPSDASATAVYYQHISHNGTGDPHPGHGATVTSFHLYKEQE